MPSNPFHPTSPAADPPADQPPAGQYGGAPGGQYGAPGGQYGGAPGGQYGAPGGQYGGAPGGQYGGAPGGQYGAPPPGYPPYPGQPGGYPGPGGGLKPHRGSTVLVLGILGLVVCNILGIIAWVMGNSDLAEMQAGTMDPSGYSSTNAGRICGIIATILMIVGVVILIIYFAIFASIMAQNAAIFVWP